MSPPSKSSLLNRIGHRTAAHPWRTIAAWVAIAIAVFVASGTIGGTTQDDYAIPGVDSQVANDLLVQRFPDQSGATARVVFHHPDGVAVDRVAVTTALARIGELPHVVGVTDPFDPAAPSVSHDGTTAIAGIAYDAPVTDVDPDGATEAIEHVVADVEEAGYQIELGGEVPENTSPPSNGTEAIGLLVAAVVLAVAFGSLLAMGLPIVIALASLGIGMSGIVLLAGAMNISTITPMIAAMVGLGVGIDYALFVVTRHRERLADGDSVVTAAAAATA
ncbi:MAG: MMPL family transporter, partial [Acidimicrobiales bacterium]